MIIKIQANPTLDDPFRIELISEYKPDNFLMTAYLPNMPIGECVRTHVKRLKEQDKT